MAKLFVAYMNQTQALARVCGELDSVAALLQLCCSSVAALLHMYQTQALARVCGELDSVAALLQLCCSSVAYVPN
jgi:hypothetical protein